MACGAGWPAALVVGVSFGSGVRSGATGVGAPERDGLVGCWQAARKELSAKVRNDRLDTAAVGWGRAVGAVGWGRVAGAVD